MRVRAPTQRIKSRSFEVVSPATRDLGVCGQPQSGVEEFELGTLNGMPVDFVLHTTLYMVKSG